MINDGRYSNEPRPIDPPEYAPTNPVHCASCDAEYDDDDISTDLYYSPDDDLYCVHCYECWSEYYEDDIGYCLFYGPDGELYCDGCHKFCDRCQDVWLAPPEMHTFEGEDFCQRCFADLLCGCPEE